MNVIDLQGCLVEVPFNNSLHGNVQGAVLKIYVSGATDGSGDAVVNVPFDVVVHSSFEYTTGVSEVSVLSSTNVVTVGPPNTIAVKGVASKAFTGMICGYLSRQS